MAIQIRRGTDAQWESNKSNIVVGEPAITTDTERVFVGTGSGTYTELANASTVAEEYNTATSYVVGDIVLYKGQLKRCNTPTSGAWVSANWDDVTLAEAIEAISGAGAIDTDNLVDGAVTTVKIADANVTADKLASNAVTTAKITDGAVAKEKLATAVQEQIDGNTQGISDLNDALGKAKVVFPVDETDMITGKFITQYGTVADHNSYAYIDSVPLKKGQTIYVKATYPDSNVMVFSFRHDDDIFVQPRLRITLSTTSITEYSYTATSDTVISVCFPISHKCYIIANVSTLAERIDSADVLDNTIKISKLNNSDFDDLYNENANKLNYDDLARGILDASGLISIDGSYRTNKTAIYCYGKSTAYAPSAVYGNYVQAVYWAFYDADGEFISRSASYQSQISIPATAYYMRVSFPLNTIETYQPMVTFSAGIPSSFIPYGRTLKTFVEEENGILMNYMQLFTNIGIVGDSLSVGAVATDGGQAIDHKKYSWLSNICRKIGATPFHFSHGGMTAKAWMTSTLKTALENETENIEAYYLALGTNDKNMSYPIGDISDSAGADSFVGYYKQIIETIHTKSPNAVIFCVSMYSKSNLDTPYSAIVEQISALYAYCYYVDFVGNAVPQLLISLSRVDTDYVENWHYTGLGYIGVGNTIEVLTNDIIKNNLQDFVFFSANQPN